MPTDGPLWEERLLRPIDIYPDYRRDPWATGGEQLDDHRFRLVAALPGDRDRRGHHRPCRPGMARSRPARPHPARPDRGRQGPARHRAALGPDAPPPGPRPPGRRHDRTERGRLRALGHQGPGVRPADLAPPRRTHANRGARLCQHAGLRGRGSRQGARAGAALPGDGLHRTEMVLPTRTDERPRRHREERRPGPHPARDARRRLRHHARLLAEPELRLRGRPLRAHRGVPAALARRGLSCPTASTATSS